MTSPHTRIVSQRVLLRDATDRTRVVRPAAVVIEGARIAAVDPDAALRPGDVDLGAALLAPAFVDGHTHLAMVAQRGLGGRASQASNVVEDLYFRVERALLPEDVRAFTRMGAWEALLSGTGYALDHYYHADQVALAFEDVGLTGSIAPTLQDLGGPGAADFERTLAITADLSGDAALRARGVSVALGAHASDTVSDRLWRDALDLATRLDLPVHVHVAQSAEEDHRARATGARSSFDRLRRAGVLDAPVRASFVHDLYVTDDDLASLDPTRHTLGYCPRSQAQFAFPAPLDAWRRARLPLLVGTDAGVCNDTIAVQQDLAWLAGSWSFGVTRGEALARFRAGAVEAAGVASERRARFEADAPWSAPDALLDAVSVAPARVAGEQVGEIAVGQLANLAVFDVDHPALWPCTDLVRALVYNQVGAALTDLWVAGRRVGDPGDVRGGVLRSERYRAHRDEAARRLADLRRRAGV